MIPKRTVDKIAARWPIVQVCITIRTQAIILRKTLVMYLSFIILLNTTIPLLWSLVVHIEFCDIEAVGDMNTTVLLG